MKNIRRATREELKILLRLSTNEAQGYLNALDEMAYLMYCVTGKSKKDLIDASREHVSDKDARVRIILSLTAPPVKLVKKEGTTETGEWIH